MDETALTNALIGIPLFEDMERDQISAILEVGTQREVETGAVLCEPMTVDDRIYVFLNGRLRIVSASGVKLSEVTETRLIGEMGVFTGQTRTSSVVAEEPSTVLELTRSSLEELVEADPELGQLLLTSLCRLLYIRVYGMNDDIEALRDHIEQLKGRLTELAPGDPLLSETQRGETSNQ